MIVCDGLFIGRHYSQQRQHARRDRALLQASRSIYLRTFATFILLCILGGWIVAVDAFNHINTQKQTTLKLAGVQSSALSQQLNASISLAYTLEAVLKDNQYEIQPEHFESLALQLMNAQPAVASLQYAPNGIVTYVVPLEGNEPIIGHNLFSDPKRNKEAFDSVEKRQLTVAGPFQLLQGGFALVARLPIFQPAGRDETFWGFSTVLIRIPELLAASGINQLSSRGYEWNLWRIHPDTGRPHIFSGTSDSLNKDYIQLAITVPNATWFLDIKPSEGWLAGYSWRMGLEIAMFLTIAGVGSGVIFILQRQPLLLQQQVELRTKELQEANSNLRASEDRFHKMFREHNAVMLLIDPDSGKIVDANKAACTFYGYTREQMVSLPIETINTFTGHETRSAMLQVKSGQKNHFEFKHRLASGEIRDIEAYSSPIIINGQSLLFSIIHDINERKRAEEELDKYRDRLEVLVEEQTRKLKKTQTELLQRERLATLGKVTAMVSHELRNPLGTIQAALFSIENSIERNALQKTVRPLELADRSINRCVKIIEEINSYARFKELDLSEAPVDDWLQAVLKEQSIPEEISCELELCCGIRPLFDQEKLRQVVVNLISNAVHALEDKPSGRKQLRISTHSLDDNYEIRFSDNGIGMSDDIKEKIFEPLYSTKGFGVGLGMVIVKNIIELHHGKISIESHPGKGTTVSLRLPIHPPEEDKQSSPH